ncbi:SAM-dependent methyltransferase [Nitrobacteraceae bacterium AZCC 1564]
MPEPYSCRAKGGVVGSPPNRGAGCYMLTYPIETLDALRSAEMDLLLQKHGQFFSGADVLEIGSGTGAQLRELSSVAKSAVGVDLHSSYLKAPENNVTYYDGVNLPFADNSFDVIYSSNTMEHVTDQPGLHLEMKRVLRPGGVAIHVVPSCAWRLWTTAIYYPMLPKLIFSVLSRTKDQQAAPTEAAPVKGIKSRMLDLICPSRHGETGNRFTEWWHFRAASWSKRFESLGWKIEKVEPLGLFYTGFLVAFFSISMKTREQLARVLGSACIIVILRDS